MIPAFGYLRPTTLAEATAALAAPGARAHGGGTDLLGCLRDGVFSAEKVVSLSGIPELRGVRRNIDGGLIVGAMTTLAEVARDPAVRAGYAALADGALSAASPQLRNQGTLGGNLCQRPRCWYYRGDFHCARKGGDTCYAAAGENQFHCLFGGNVCFYVHPSDTAPALAALDAAVRIAGKDGVRSLPVAQFFVTPDVDYTRETVLAPGEVVTEVVLPALPAGTRSAYRKVRARGSWDFALVGAAAAVTLAGGRVTRARIVLSGVAAAPWRVPAAERRLVGGRITEATVRAAAAAAAEGAEPLAENGYKVDLLRGAVEEALLRLA